MSTRPPTATRAEKALATRRRMLQAAYGQFCRNGYLGATIDAIAADAGVAVPTIYYTFETKARLLEEAFGAAVVGFDHWRPPAADQDLQQLLPWHEWWPEFDAAPTAAEALRIFLRNNLEILARVAPLVSTLHGAVGDPEAAEVLRVAEERRIQAYREAVHVVAAKPGGLRRGLSRRTACDVLAVLSSAELYHATRQGRGWSRARTAGFIEELVTSQLLDG